MRVCVKGLCGCRDMSVCRGVCACVCVCVWECACIQVNVRAIYIYFLIYIIFSIKESIKSICWLIIIKKMMFCFIFQSSSRVVRATFSLYSPLLSRESLPQR